MLSNRTKKIISTLTLTSIITTGFASIDTYAVKNPKYILNESSIVYKKPKILIYHTHTLEEYIDSDVVEMGEDLKIKLEKKGFIVDHITDNFSADYNNAYNSSREFLESISLLEYAYIIDYHRNSATPSNTTEVKGVKVAKGMFVYDKYSKNYTSSKEIGDNIIEKFNNFSTDLTRDNFIYDGGINSFNTDLSDNILLWESGDINNTKLEIMRLNTYFASTINQLLSKIK